MGFKPRAIENRSARQSHADARAFDLRDDDRGSVGGKAKAARASIHIIGASCGDWFDAPHTFTVKFERSLTNDEMGRLGELFEKSLQSGAMRPGGPWRWSGAFALFEVDERYDSLSCPPVGAVKRFLQQAQAIVPVTDVVYENARELDPAELAGAVPGPDWGVTSLRGVDRGLSAPTPNQTFERGRSEGSQIAEREEILRILAEEEKQPVHLVRCSKIFEPPPERWTEADMVGFDTPESQICQGFLCMPRMRMVNMGSWWRPADGDHPMTNEHGRRVAAVFVAGRGLSDIAWIDENNQRRTAEWPEEFERLNAFAMHPSGDSAIVGTKQTLFRLHFATGVASVCFRQPEPGTMFTDVAYLGGGDRLAVGTLRAILMIDPTAEKPEPLTSIKGHGGTRIAACLGGRAFVVENVDGTTVYAYAGGKLEKIASSRAPLQLAHDHEGRLYLSAHGDWFEWVGVADAVDAFVSKTER